MQAEEDENSWNVISSANGGNLHTSTSVSYSFGPEVKKQKKSKKSKKNTFIIEDDKERRLFENGDEM